MPGGSTRRTSQNPFLAWSRQCRFSRAFPPGVPAAHMSVTPTNSLRKKFPWGVPTTKCAPTPFAALHSTRHPQEAAAMRRTHQQHHWQLCAAPRLLRVCCSAVGRCCQGWACHRPPTEGTIPSTPARCPRPSAPPRYLWDLWQASVAPRATKGPPGSTYGSPTTIPRRRGTAAGVTIVTNRRRCTTVAVDGDSRSSRSVGMAAVVSQVDPLHPDHALGPVRHRDNPSAALADGVQPGAAKRVRRWLAAWVRYHVRQQSPVTSGAAGTPACPHCKVPNQKLCLPRVCRHGTICGTIWVTAVGILASPCAACQNRAERSCLPVQ